MTIEIKETLTGSILDIGGGGEAVIGQIYKDRVTAIDNCEEELEEAPDCCSKQLMDATELLFPDDSFDNVTFCFAVKKAILRNIQCYTTAIGVRTTHNNVVLNH